MLWSVIIYRILNYRGHLDPTNTSMIFALFKGGSMGIVQSLYIWGYTAQA